MRPRGVAICYRVRACIRVAGSRASRGHSLASTATAPTSRATATRSGSEPMPGYRCWPRCCGQRPRWYQPGAFRSGTSRVGRGRSRPVVATAEAACTREQHAGPGLVVALSGAGAMVVRPLSNLASGAPTRVAIIAGPGVAFSPLGILVRDGPRLRYPATILDPLRSAAHARLLLLIGCRRAGGLLRPHWVDGARTPTSWCAPAERW